MFIVEYRTISRLGMVYPTRVATLGLHKATSAAEAAAHILKTTPHVEIVNVEYRSVGA